MAIENFSFVGLGSNLNNPMEQVTTAIKELDKFPHTKTILSSSLYQSSPVGPAGQEDYINAVVKLQTSLSPIELLNFLQHIENAHQRKRIQHWGPRTLDLDLLLYNQQQIESERLKVPHPYLTLRNFVLYPLLEIAPDVRLPDGTPLRECKMANNGDGLKKVSTAPL